MATKGFFDHHGSDGKTPKTRVKRAGYRTCLTAENISFGWRSVDQVMQVLMQSPKHRANILREDGLEGIEAPVMLISGANSPPIVHEIADGLAARLPDVGRATVPDAGHMLPLTHAQAVADLVRMNIERA